VLELFFATTNPGKLRELRRLVADLPVRVVSPEDLGRALPEVVEDGSTFRENAEKKASAYARFSRLHALADDSGLCVDALGGAPGVHSARWSELEDGFASPACALPEVSARELGPELTRASRDEANNDKLLTALSGVPEARRGGEYVAVLAVARPDGSIAAQVEGRCRGRIGRARRGSGGFGYDPLFIPTGGPPSPAGILDGGAAEKLPAPPCPPLAPGQPFPAAPSGVRDEGAAEKLPAPSCSPLAPGQPPPAAPAGVRDEGAAEKLPAPSCSPLAPGQPPPAGPALVAGDRTMSELTPGEKDAISHRGAAFRALRPALEKLAFDKTRP
jgi:XTP/dITP diphosphohydrolase